MPGLPSQPLPRVESVPQDQASAFAILRRPQVEGDSLPEERWPSLEGGMVGRLGLNPSLARRASTDAGDAWVIPGNGFVCLDCGGACCNTAEAAAAGQIVTWTSTRSGDRCIVHGLVPDGVSEVTLVTTTGATGEVSVRDNVYGAVLDGPFLATVRFIAPAGPVELGPWGG